MEYIVEMKSTDGVGGWSEWEPAAKFRYAVYAKEFVRMVKGYQHEQAAIDQVQIRLMNDGTEVQV